MKVEYNRALVVKRNFDFDLITSFK